MSKPRGKDRPAEAKPFAVRFVPGKGWQVRQGANWRAAREVTLQAFAITSQNGELVGQGVVQRDGQTIRVTA